MKIRSWLLVVLIFGGGTSGFAQLRHEVKIDFSTLFGNVITPHYEMILSEKIGVELSLEYNLNEFFVVEKGPDFFLNYIGFDAERFNPSVGMKYYTSEKRYGFGFFVGPYFRLNYLLSRDPLYVTKWEEVNNEMAPDYISRSPGLDSFQGGLQTGYKFLIKSNFIIEILGTVTAQKYVRGRSEEFDDPLLFDLSGFIRFGYRF